MPHMHQKGMKRFAANIIEQSRPLKQSEMASENNGKETGSRTVLRLEGEAGARVLAQGQGLAWFKFPADA